MAGKIQSIKGTVDILPGDVHRWHFIEEVIREQMDLFNYTEMRTPVFEKTELFARGIGELTDIVSKEMYTFLDKGKKSLTLKPEMTAPIMRSYIQHSLQNKSQVNKIYYISPMFRQENPQAGRQRQFNQFGAEAIGSNAPELDAEVIMLALAIFEKAGVRSYSLELNSVGDPASREKFKSELQDFLKPDLAKLCESCQSRFESNPMRILDCKVKSCRELIEDAPVLIDFLDQDNRNHYEAVKTVLNANAVTFTENPRLVRGLDYYTNTVFEITSTSLGAQDAICGGGRYNLLAAELGGPDIPAVGFAAGMERMLMVLEKDEADIPEPEALDVYFINLGKAATEWAHTHIHWLRKAGIKADTDYLSRSMKAQMRDANKQNSRFVVIAGDNELSEGQVIIKEMATSEQFQVKITDLRNRLIELIND